MGAMKVLVHYKSGVSQVFIVPQETHVAEFRRMAEEIGGPLRKVEFSSATTKMDWKDSSLGHRV